MFCLEGRTKKMNIFSEYHLTEYQLNTDVRRGHQLYGMSGKIIYNGSWRRGRNDPIIIVEMSDTIADREALFYLQLNNHPNIISTLGYIPNQANLTIFIQEFAPHNDLASVLLDNQFVIPLSTLLEMFKQVTSAMSYVASHNIVHADLGCRNVLVFRADTDEPTNTLVKLTDFGLARWTDIPLADETSTVIPIRFCAPEIVRNSRHEDYSEKSDVYSMGVLIWEALSNGQMPYSSVNEDDDVKKMKLNNNAKLTRPERCDRQLWTLMSRCWHADPQRRPTFEMIEEALSNVDVSKLTDLYHSVAIYEQPQEYKYKLDVHVKMHEIVNGQFGQTYRATWISKRTEPIVLVVMKDEPSEYETLVYTKFTSHDHILTTYGFVENDKGFTLLLQESTPYGNLQALLQNGQFQPSPQVLVTLFLQIVEAMIYVLSQGIIHGDLRCANILVCQMDPSKPEKNSIKLTNFSSARPKNPSFVDNRRLPIPFRYCALEILRSAGQTQYSEYSDAYSLGVLMWEACSKGTLPYQSSPTNAEVRQRKLKDELLPKPVTSCNEHMWSIIRDCWAKSPECRYEFEGIKKRLQKVTFKPVETYRYELGRNISDEGSISGLFHRAEWIPKKDNEPIILRVLNDTQSELFCYRTLKHPHVIRTYDLVKNDLHLVMLLQERALHGNLQISLQNGKFRPLSKVKVTIFLQIVDGMMYLTQQGVVHGDLRCANVLLIEMHSSETAQNRVKITNFGVARVKDQTYQYDKSSVAPIRYRAPEFFRTDDESNFSELSDVYSMGVLMWEVCSQGAIPYGVDTSDQEVRRRRMQNESLLQPKGCHSQIWNVIKECLYSESTLRDDFSKLQRRLSAINLIDIDCVRCDICKKNIPENEMNQHQKSCPRKRPLEDQTSPPVHFTRCKHCGERCLASEMKEHLTTCPSQIPSKVTSRPILIVKCDYCGEDIPSDQILIHKKSCPDNATPILHHKPSNLIPCEYCQRSYADTELMKHQRSCPQKPKPTIPESQCHYCNYRWPSIDIENHEKICPKRPPPPKPVTPQRACQYCKESHSLQTIHSHEDSCPSKPLSCMDRLRSWVCGCCGTN